MRARTALLVFLLPAVADARDELRLVPSDVAAGDRVGTDVAISGTTVLVGSYEDDDLGDLSGSAYLFDATTGAELHKLLASDGAAYDGFGERVAIDGTTALIGAVGDDDSGSYSGAAYLFDTASGQETHKLLASDGIPGQHFGFAVALDDALAVVGAMLDDDNGTWSGSAYVFDATTGLLRHKLVASDGAPGDRFGHRVAVSGATILVGALENDANGAGSGAAYLFDAATGAQLAKLLPNDGAPDDWFGFAVAIDGTLAAISALRGGAETGAVYLFDATTGQQLARLVPADGDAGDKFGQSVSVSGSTVVVGMPYDDDAGMLAGAAYVFDATTGAQVGKLVAAGAAPGDLLGVGVGVSGERVVAGAPGSSPGGPASGSASVFSARAAIGTSVCGPAAGNSTGVAATLRASGSDTLSDDDVRLTASHLPPGQFALFLTSRTPDASTPPGAQGTLCLGGAIGRYTQDVASIDASGCATLTLDLAQLPTSGAPVAAQAGATWYFQAWYRDAHPAPTSNLTDAVAITFR